MAVSTNMARINDMVRMSAGGALDGVVRMEMYNTLKEFFQRSDAWILELPVYIVPQSNDYQLETGQNIVINRLMGLGRVDNLPNGTPDVSYLPMCPPQYLMSGQHGAGSEAQDPRLRVQRAGVLLNAGAKCPILRIDHNPSENEIWVAILAVNICDPVDSEGFTSPPDWVLEKYMSYIASGVLMRLMLQPGKPYSSPQGATYHGRKFNEGVGIARTEVRRMFTYGSQRWEYPGGWNSGKRNTGFNAGHA